MGRIHVEGSKRFSKTIILLGEHCSLNLKENSAQTDLYFLLISLFLNYNYTDALNTSLQLYLFPNLNDPEPVVENSTVSIVF